MDTKPTKLGFNNWDEVDYEGTISVEYDQNIGNHIEIAGRGEVRIPLSNPMVKRDP